MSRGDIDTAFALIYERFGTWPLWREAPHGFAIVFRGTVLHRLADVEDYCR